MLRDLAAAPQLPNGCKAGAHCPSLGPPGSAVSNSRTSSPMRTEARVPDIAPFRNPATVKAEIGQLRDIRALDINLAVLLDLSARLPGINLVGHPARQIEPGAAE